MNLNEFREVIESNTDVIINDINNYLNTIENRVAENFKGEKYNFSWSSLTNEMRKYYYIYSKKENRFIRMNEEEIHSKNEFNINTKFEDYTSTLTSKINSDVLEKYKIFCSEYNMLSQSYILSKLLSEAINKYI